MRKFHYLSGDVAKFIKAPIFEPDAIRLGRVTCDIFAVSWPSRTHNEFGVAHNLNGAPKYGVSSRWQRQKEDFSMLSLNKILERSAARHNHLCPRQVLGVRIGLAGAQALGLEIPSSDKRLIVIVETDGCFADGVEAATGCTVGHRTLRVEDYGKIAATFVNSRTGQSVRIAPVLDVRKRANAYAAGETRHYFAQLAAYQVMRDVELLSIQEVSLTTPIDELVGSSGVRINCELCGEEIINKRQVMHAGMILCRACAKRAYYQSSPIEIHLPALSLVRLPEREL